MSGIDGSGKSTQLELLERALRDRGRSPRRLWFRPGYSAALDGARALMRRLRPGLIPAPTDRLRRDAAFGRASVRLPWIALAVADAVAHYAVRVRGLLARGHDVICDRGVPDAILDLALRFPDVVAEDGAVARLLEAAAPTPDRAFLLLVSRETMLARCAAKAEPFPDAPALRDARLAAYERLARSRAGWRVIDAERPIEVVHEELLAATLDEERRAAL